MTLNTGHKALGIVLVVVAFILPSFTSGPRFDCAAFASPPTQPAVGRPSTDALGSTAASEESTEAKLATKAGDGQRTSDTSIPPGGHSGGGSVFPFHSPAPLRLRCPDRNYTWCLRIRTGHDQNSSTGYMSPGFTSRL
jgi:hypothetical protein